MQTAPCVVTAVETVLPVHVICLQHFSHHIPSKLPDHGSSTWVKDSPWRTQLLYPPRSLCFSSRRSRLVCCESIRIGCQQRMGLHLMPFLLRWDRIVDCNCSCCGRRKCEDEHQTLREVRPHGQKLSMWVCLSAISVVQTAAEILSRQEGD